ncbi:MAG TPA: MFS transporter [Ktedonobacteraceae bacterium]|jgi:MFS family permease|nr:MFS transporter [Ktedonobacteraceae bacterium]
MSTSQDNLTGSTQNAAPPLWRNRDFLLLWSGQSVSSLGTGISSLALPLLILALTGSPTIAGLVSGAGSLIYFILTLPAGALADRWDRKRVMIICNALLGLNMASIPVALLIGHLTITQLFINSLVSGACTIFLYVAEKASLPRVVTKQQLPQAMAQYEASESAITLVSPSLGGILYSLARAVPFVADAVSYLLLTIALLFIKQEFQQERTTARQELFSEIREGIVWLWRHPLLRSMTLLMAGLFFVLAFGDELPLIVVAQSHGATPAIIGLIFAADGVGGLLGAFCAPWFQKRYRIGHIIIGIHWGFALLWPLYALAPNALLLGAIGIVVGFIDQIHDVTWISYRIGLIPDALQGRVTSTYRLISRSLRPAGLALSGICIQHIGAPQTFLVAAACLVVLAVLTTLSRDVRRA